MFAGRAAAEIIAGEENRRALIARLVQEEGRIRRSVLLFSPIEKQPFPQAGPLDRL